MDYLAGNVQLVIAIFVVFNFIKAYLELIFNMYAMYITFYFCLKVAPTHIVDMYWSISVTYAS